MPEINWGLGVMPDIGGNAMQAFEQGRARKEAELGRNALSAYAVNPDENNFNALAQYHPQFAIQERQTRQKAEADNANAQSEYVANAAYDIIRHPPEQRAAVMDEYIRRAPQFPQLQQYLGQYSDGLINSIIAKVGQGKEFASYQDPKYVPIGEMGLAGFQFGQPLQQGGQPQNFGQGQPQVAQAPQGGPQPGTIEDGHRFKGGDPSNPASWEEVGPQGAQLLSREQYQGAVNSLGKEAADAWIQRNGFSVGN